MKAAKGLISLTKSTHQPTVGIKILMVGKIRSSAFDQSKLFF
jgi:hypothetical protein